MPRNIVQNFANSLAFSGNGYVALGTSSVLNALTDYTLEGWVKTSGVGNMTIYTSGYNSGTNHGIAVRISAPPTMSVQSFQGSSSVNSGVGTVPLNNWFHLAVTQSGNTASIYINGVLTGGNQTLTFRNPISAACFFGAQTTGTLLYTGKLKNFQVYNRALSPAEVQSRFSGYAVGTPVGAWAMNEGTGTTVNDSSGNAITGTTTNAVWDVDVPTASRSLSATRTTAQNINTSAYFNGGISASGTTPIANLGAGLTFATWFKSPTINGQYNIIGNAPTTTDSFNVQLLFNSGLSAAYNNGTNQGAQSVAPTRIKLNQWNHVVYTYDGAGNGSIYFNGVKGADSTTGPVSAGTGLKIGARADNNRRFYGSMSQMLIYNRPISDTEALNLYTNGSIPTSPTAYWPMSEGSGTTLYDVIGGNNATTINLSWYKDTPGTKRGLVSDNLIWNGDFEYAPITNSLQTIGTRYLDGTSSGSTTNTNFGWSMAGNNGTGTGIQFSNVISHSGATSLQMVTANPGNNVELHAFSGFSGNTFPQVPIQPNTSYTLTGWLNITSLSGSATTGLRFGVYLSNGSGGLVSNFFTPVGSFTTVTNGWVQMSLTFTSTSTAVYANPMVRIIGNDGAATLMMTAYVDDMVLLPNPLLTRQLAS